MPPSLFWIGGVVIKLQSHHFFLDISKIALYITRNISSYNVEGSGKFLVILTRPVLFYFTCILYLTFLVYGFKHINT